MIVSVLVHVASNDTEAVRDTVSDSRDAKKSAEELESVPVTPGLVVCELLSVLVIL